MPKTSIPAPPDAPATPRPSTSAAAMRLFEDDRFVSRHLGPRPADIAAMLKVLGYASLDDLVDAIVPPDIRLRRSLALPAALTEKQALDEMRSLADQNQVFRSYLGLGYSDTITPPVILRNILENPGWYTAYTPYQAEIAQGRLEALLNFQTMISDLTGLEVANASLLDEGTAAAEALHMTEAVTTAAGPHKYFIDEKCHPQTIAVVKTRAEARGVETIEGSAAEFQFMPGVIGALIQYPATDGEVQDWRGFCDRAHAAGALVTVATDLLSLVLLEPPGSWGADIAVGNSQRFGVPLGFGGPHAAFFATRDQYKRVLPGRIIGVSKDRAGRPALRMALQTREQHIRREKATSNVCTAQVLLAVIAGMYAVWHGPEGLTRIAKRVHGLAGVFAESLRRIGFTIVHQSFFDTILVETDARTMSKILTLATERQINIRVIAPTRVSVAFDEVTSPDDVRDLVQIFAGRNTLPFDPITCALSLPPAIPAGLARKSAFLTHPVFHRHRSETEMLRYLKMLEDRDLSLTSAMIPLGSCTMKLNATSEMIPVTWAGLGRIHPFAPKEQSTGYQQLFERLETALAEITGFAAVSLQPNAGSQGEFAGLLVIRAFHAARDQGHRDTCLIPQSAHGTNPASAVMAGYKVVVVKTDLKGNIDVEDLRAKAKEHAGDLAALMVTYPSTHGVFESSIAEICRVVHENGGQVYMDGANMNAQVGLCRPGDIGADVCHLNLHKTFCIPHGGGGPGMGPIGVAKHLAPFLPSHPLVDLGHAQGSGTVSAAPWGSASILPISMMYIMMMGPDGLTDATKVAILNANYIARRLEGHYNLLYSGNRGLIAHECIIDTRPFKVSAGVEVEDIAKRLIDFGFHPPTVSFPVPGTLMVEPTESESKEELDRYCDAMIAIRQEMQEIEDGKAVKGNNLLSNSPHTLADVTSDGWDRPYSRERAGFPTAATRMHKVWPTVGRIDQAFGDRNLVCTCPPVSDYES